MKNKIKAAVIGANGYAGAETARLLFSHPQVELVALTSRANSGKQVCEIIPGIDKSLVFVDADAPAIKKADVVFVALPQTAGAQIVGELIDGGVRVVDLSADYRFDDVDTYNRVYGVTHPRPDLSQMAVYGLCEHNREKIKSAKLVANPGCYVTSALLPLLPLAKANLATDIIIDAKSGVSGAGRKSDEAYSFCALDESFKAYGVFTHRHAPEIAEKLGTPVLFTPHLLPIKRGILSTIYFKTTDANKAESILKTAYENEPFVSYSPALPQISEVAHTNRCVFSAKFEETRGIIVSVIDNLLKGAAGQAVQNMNIMFGLDETAGLPTVSPI
ncbi:MAG: N-acetyl-gamma-glutamyl-phosphate reductase [Clostridiales bacterium]|nr:N-acetyl-gamma-glutamyl-phosphate reductase [Clostridiales bacterium]